MDVKPPFAVEGRSFGCGNPPSSLLGVKIQEPAFRGTMKPKTFGFANRLWDKRKATHGVAFLYLIMKVTTYIFTYRKKRGYKNIV